MQALPKPDVQLNYYLAEVKQELSNILGYWMRHAVDHKYGGFVGKIDQDNLVDASAPKGSVLNSRILWSFSAGFQLTGDQRYLAMAESSFSYIKKYFIDHEFGGVYWTVNYKGEPLDTKKQIYALSFAVYGLSEYFLVSKNEEAKSLAIGIYESIVRHSYDSTFGGYIEALTRD